jgi:pyridoxine 5-phosphate synthase
MNPLVAPEAFARGHRTALSVNVNKIALLRNTRHLGIPDVVKLSRQALHRAPPAR